MRCGSTSPTSTSTSTWCRAFDLHNDNGDADIADRARDCWEQSNTRELIRVVSERNSAQVTNGRFVPQVRMVKTFCNEAPDLDVCGLVAESLAFDAVTTRMSDGRALLVTFQRSARLTSGSLTDPTGVDDWRAGGRHASDPVTGGSPSGTAGDEDQMRWTTFLAAAEPAAPAESSGLPTWLTIIGSAAAVLLSSSAVAAAFGAMRASAAERRREYTAAARALTAWAEYPWRIRRRTSDQPEVAAALADRGHDLQEALADREAWCAAEHEVMGQLVAHLRTQLSVQVRPAIEKAWAETDLITDGADMNLSESSSSTAARMNCGPASAPACTSASAHGVSSVTCAAA